MLCVVVFYQYIHYRQGTLECVHIEYSGLTIDGEFYSFSTRSEDLIGAVFRKRMITLLPMVNVNKLISYILSITSILIYIYRYNQVLKE